MGSIALDNIFEADSVPSKGQRVFGRLLGSHAGGIGANQAREAARYCDTVYMLGQISTDASGSLLARQLESSGVLLDRLYRTELPCGQSYMYLVDGKSDYFSVVTQGANTGMDPARIRAQLAGLDAVLVSLEISPDAALAALQGAREAGCRTYLVPSPSECCTPQMLDLAGALILNRREAEQLLGISGQSVEALAAQLQSSGVHHDPLLISLGSLGALLRCGGQVCYAPCHPVEVLDTVGAGDALAGAFVAAYEKGIPPYQALCYGCIAGGLIVAVVGAQNSSHDEARLLEIYKQEYEARKDSSVI